MFSTSKCHYMDDNPEAEIQQKDFKINKEPYCFPAVRDVRKHVLVSC